MFCAGYFLLIVQLS
uniref:Uncharacterized protein n=1 Tax=Arundo donax TaxID=35708 RepID=A0A0A9FM13_ARUDO